MAVLQRGPFTVTELNHFASLAQNHYPIVLKLSQVGLEPNHGDHRLSAFRSHEGVNSQTSGI
jgi:hypothetical protein